MGLFNALKNTFFGSDIPSDLQEEDVDFKKWEEAHRKWKERLEKVVDGSSTENFDLKVVCSDNKCDLGKWLHGNGKKFYGSLKEFQELIEDHAHFHVQAGEVINMCQCGHKEEARKSLSMDFGRASIKVIVGLTKLKSRIS